MVPQQQLRWYQGLSRYHWWVLIIGVASWMFDCMDQRLFVLSRASAVKELLGEAEFKNGIRDEIERDVTAQVQPLVGPGFAGLSMQGSF